MSCTMKYEIWAEGHSGVCEIPVELRGTVEATSFEEACCIVFTTDSGLNPRFSKDRLTIGSRRLFDHKPVVEDYR
jgi:hypothetical protein